MRLQSHMVSVLLGLAISAMPIRAQYSVKLPYKDVTVRNVNGSAVFDRAFCSGNPGQPNLPVYKVSFLLPSEVDFKDVSVILNKISEDILPDRYEVAPCSDYTPEMINRMNIHLVDGKDMQIYAKNAFFPESYKTNVSFGKMGQYKILSVMISPYSYNPVTKKLRTLTNGTLSLNFTRNADSKKIAKLNTQRNPGYEQSLKDIIVNPEIFESYGSTPYENLQTMSLAPGSISNVLPLSEKVFFIFTTQEIYEFSNIDAYENSLRTRGAKNVEVFQLDGSTGPFVAEYIKSIIYHSYTNDPVGDKVTDVVLIGNPDPDKGDVPMYKYKDTFLQMDFATDYYYADIDNPVFPDCFAEINVGRIPAYNKDFLSLNQILNRSIDYVNKTGSDTEWRRFALLPTVPLGLGINGPVEESFEFADNVNSSLSGKGWGTYRLYEPYDYRRCVLLPPLANMTLEPTLPEELSCNYDKVISAWKFFNPGLVVFCSHGCLAHAIDVLSSSSVRQLGNRYPAMVIANSCETIKNPEDGDGVSTNLGYLTLFYNAINYFGATVEVKSGLSHEFCTNLVSLLNDDINNPLSGAALTNAKKMCPETDSYKHILCGYNLYGIPDASLNLTTLSATSPRLSAPNLTEVRASQQDPKSKIKIVWQAVPNATGYVIERGDETATRVSGFQILATITSGSTTSYYNNNLLPGKKFKYRIYATKQNGTSTERSGYSKIDSATTYNQNGKLFPDTPEKIDVFTGSNTLTPSWKYRDCQYYIVQRATSSDGPFVTIATVNNGPNATFSFDDRNVNNGVLYSYRVAAVNQAGPSSFCLIGSSSPSPNLTAPTNLSVNLKDGSYTRLKFSWQMDNGYQPLFFKISYYRMFPEGQWSTLQYADTSYRRDARYGEDNNGIIDNRFQHLKFAGNVQYQFQIHSGTYDNSDREFLSSPSNSFPFKTVSTFTPPLSPEPVEGTSNYPEMARIDWLHPQPGNPEPLGYTIFQKIDGTWLFRGDQINVRYFEVPVGANVSSNFCVQAFSYNVNNNERIYSDFSTIVTARGGKKLRAPDILIYQDEITSHLVPVHISTSSLNTINYVIERSTDGTNFEYYKTISSDIYKFDDDNVSPSTTYYYRAYGIGATGTEPSDRCTSESAQTPSAPATNIAIGKTSSASSQYSSTYNAAKGNDNLTTSRWRASSTSVPQWWKVDLGSNHSLVGSEVMWQESGSIYKYRIEVSTNNSTWTTVADLTNNTNTSQTQSQTFNATARYVRIYITAVPSGKTASFFEFRVMGL